MISNTQLQLQLHSLSQLNHRIFSQQNLMRVYAQHEHELERNTLLAYAEMTVSPNTNSIQSLLEQIHLLIAGTDELKSVGSTGLLELIADNLKVNGELEPIRRVSFRMRREVVDCGCNWCRGWCINEHCGRKRGGRIMCAN